MSEILAGRYRLVDRLADGADEVWRGYDEVRQFVVAVRLHRTGPATDTGFVERFRMNARALTRQVVAGFAPILEYGVEESVGPYLVVEYVDADSVSRILERAGTLGAALTTHIVAHTADSLGAAHAIGFVHRGIRPRKMFLRPDGGVVLADLCGGGFPPPQLGANLAVHYVRYLSPEEIKGGQASAGADIYALGVVAYTCLAGRPPFDSTDPLQLAMMHVRDAPESLPARIPAPVRALITAALAQEPADRPDAVELAAWARTALD